MSTAHARSERADRHEPRPGTGPGLRVAEERPGTRPELRVAEERPRTRPERRTVTIRGQAAPPPRRRSPAAAQISARPDRVAMWAVLLGLFLAFMAVATARAEPAAEPPPAAPLVAER